MQKREIWKVIVFGIITLGIYDLVWYAKTRKELIAKTGAKIPRVFYLILPFLIYAVAILAFVISSAMSAAPQPQTDGSTLYESGVGEPMSTLSIVFLVIAIGSLLSMIPIFIVFLHRYSKAVETVTKGATTFGTAFGLGLLLNFLGVSFVWPAIIQDAYNKLDA